MNVLYLVRSPDDHIHTAISLDSLDALLDALYAKFGDDAQIGIRAELQPERSR